MVITIRQTIVPDSFHTVRPDNTLGAPASVRVGVRAASRSGRPATGSQADGKSLKSREGERDEIFKLEIRKPIEGDTFDKGACYK